MKANLSTNWGYLAKEILLILVFSYLLVFASTHNGLVDINTLRITTILLSVLWLAWAILGQSRLIQIELPVGIFLFVLLITSFTSMDPRRSFAEVWLLGIAFFWLLITTDISRRGWPAELIHKAILIVGAIIMAFAWVGVGFWVRDWHAATGQWLPDINYRLPVSNFFSVLLNVLLMVALGRWLLSPNKTNRFLLGFWVISAIVLQFLTSSRGGWMGSFAGLICLAGLYFYFEPEKWQFWVSKFRRMRWAWILVALFCVILLIGGAWLLNRQLQHPTHVPLADSRGYLWQPAWKAFLASPWLGVGPYTYASLFMRAHSVPPEQSFVYSHNIYLDLLSGSGLIGLLAGAWLGWRTLKILFSGLKIRTGFDRGVLMGALAALAAFGVHGLVDSVHHTIPTSAWVLALVVGPALGCALGNSDKIRHVSISIAAGLLVVIGAWATIWITAPLDQGVRSANVGNWQEAVSQLQLAAQRDPKDAIVHQQLGLAYSVLAANGTPSLMEQAKQELQTAVDLDPDWALNQANLGVVYGAQGNWEKAQYWMQKAVQRAAFSALFQLNLGITAEENQDLTTAKKAYQQVFRIQPDWINAHFWQQTDFRKKIWADWRSSHPEPLLSTQKIVEQRIANPGIVDPYLLLIPRYLDQGNLDQAEELLRAAKLSYIATPGQDLELRWLEAELAAKKGDTGLAYSLGTAVIADYQQWGLDGPGSYGKSVYAQLMFRRPAMMKELVNQMVTIGMTDTWQERSTLLESWRVSQ